MNTSMNRQNGQVQERQLGTNNALSYFLYVPTKVNKNASVLVSVHGISRNARKHARRFSRYAERHGVVIVAPLFDEQNYAGYQRLGLSGNRADLALNQILDEVSQLTQANVHNLYLFGYSGGGQFVHRYAMAYPNRVKAIAVGAAGWYTLPDASQRFPYGIAPHPKLPDLTFSPSEFLRIPAYILVGEQDIMRDPALRQSKRLDKQQGHTRFERGKFWVEAMKQAVEQYEHDTEFRFIALPKADHSFTRSIKSGGMADQVFNCLFGIAPARKKTRSISTELSFTPSVHFSCS